jgi:hypothetical protein
VVAFGVPVSLFCLGLDTLALLVTVIFHESFMSPVHFSKPVSQNRSDVT